MITLIEIQYNGVKVYDVDGKPVKVWPGTTFCQKCGRRLTDPRSQRRGYGPECAPPKWYSARAAHVILAIGDNVPEKYRAGYHPIIELVQSER